MDEENTDIMSNEELAQTISELPKSIRLEILYMIKGMQLMCDALRNSA